MTEVTGVVRGLGFVEILTSALSPAEQRPFLDFGYRTHETLRLLRLSLGGEMPPPPGRRTQRMRRRDQAASLAVDSASFPRFWQFDAEALTEARSATPVSRRRVMRDGGAIVGYAVTGRGDSNGFIQRLAVGPHHRGRGIGGALLADALRWLHRSGVHHVFVNTQPGNDAALSLYRRFGFTEQSEGLAVLRLADTPDVATPSYDKWVDR